MYIFIYSAPILLYFADAGLDYPARYVCFGKEAISKSSAQKLIQPEKTSKIQHGGKYE